jgi:predicted MFS family arabinose efflux permease
MTLNASVQSAAMGLAAIAGGLIIGRDAQGHLTHYWVAGVVGVMVSLSTIWMAARVHVHEAPHRT